MKHSEKISCATVLAWIFPVLLMVPNIILAFTEPDPLLSKAANLTLPLGVYLLLMAASRNVGRTILWMIPLMVFAALQIVLLYLYGEAITAIDMYINIATTNSSEACELLSGLLIALVTVIVLYLPPIVLAIVMICRNKRYPAINSRRLAVVGIALAVVGASFCFAAKATSDRFSFRRNIFPVNVVANLFEATHRTINASNYKSTSDDYTFNAKQTHDPTLKEIYVVVVGETSRADNWQLFGYDRPTNPRLSQRDDIITYPLTLSECNTTHKSVPMLLSPLTSGNFGDSIYYVKSLPAEFDEAGFDTAFLSNQQRNHSFIDYFGEQAHVCEFVKDQDLHAHDMVLVDSLMDFIDRSDSDKLFIVLHTYGSHYKYRERYTDDCRVFTPDDAAEASATCRDELINAYNNSIVYTDHMLDRLFCSLDSLDAAVAVVYTSDHGEDIFDDSRNRFLHASPTTTFAQLHVPMIIWTSSHYNECFPDKAKIARDHCCENVSSSRSLYNTIISLAGIDTPVYDPHADLTSTSYTEPARIYLNDYNEAVSLADAGFKAIDFENAHRHGIATN